MVILFLVVQRGLIPPLLLQPPTNKTNLAEIEQKQRSLMLQCLPAIVWRESMLTGVKMMRENEEA